jgi:hypothetical protein
MGAMTLASPGTWVATDGAIISLANVRVLQRADRDSGSSSRWLGGKRFIDLGSMPWIEKRPNRCRHSTPDEAAIDQGDALLAACLVVI